MTWWLLAFCSAALLGGYDSFKKISLKDNAVVPVLLINTVLSAAIFSPFLFTTGWGGWAVQKYILLKSALVLSSWMAGYFAMKNLPLTIVGPINATRPVLVLLGAIFIFDEHLNALQWGGVILAMVAYFLMRLSGHKEGIKPGNKWLVCLILAVILGAASGLYDKFLMSPERLGLDRSQVLAWYTLYQAGMMALVLVFLWLPVRRRTTPFRWDWSIPFISIFLCGADYLYMQALSQPDALIAVVSMIRRGSVLVSFAIGAFILKEKNIRSKAMDLVLLLASMVLLYFGSK
ncbi:MAG: EamA family transporter [Bacteroidales bacterium]|nr:EamA family transporter [Bacteroidales bacterium]